MQVDRYTKTMGGVNLIGSVKGRANRNLQTKRWHLKVFDYLLKVSIFNTFTLQKKCGKDPGTYIRYVEELAMQLVSDGTSRDKTTDITSTIDSGSHFSHMFSTTEHYPSIFGTAKQCKYHNTRVRTTYGCQGRKVFMCPAPCFGKYHLNLTKGRTFASHTTTSVSGGAIREECTKGKTPALTTTSKLKRHKES